MGRKSLRIPQNSLLRLSPGSPPLHNLGAGGGEHGVRFQRLGVECKNVG